MRHILTSLAVMLLASVDLLSQTPDPVIRVLEQVNAQLTAMGTNVRAEGIEFFTVGQGRPPVRLHQAGTRWVPNDSRRLAQGSDLTYLVDQSDGATTSGLANGDTEPAIDQAMDTWDSVRRCARNLTIVKRADSGADPDIFDAFFGFGAFGNPLLADITHAGWLPPTFFTAVDPVNGSNTLAFTVPFIFVNPDGSPTDINNDGYLDTALMETYYNNAFNWGIDVNQPGIDVETVALHETGHALELGHFGPPPRAVMNVVYLGLLQSLLPIDLAGHCAVFGPWPNR